MMKRRLFSNDRQKFLEQNSSILTHRKKEHVVDFQKEKSKATIESESKKKLQPSSNSIGSFFTSTVDSISSYFTNSPSLEQSQPKLHSLDDLITKAMTLPDEEIDYSLKNTSKRKHISKR